MKPETQIRIGSITAFILPLVLLVISLFILFTGNGALGILIVFLVFSPQLIFLLALMKRKLLLAKILFVILFLQYLFWTSNSLISLKESITLNVVSISISIISLSLFWLGIHGLKQLKAAEPKSEITPNTEY
jgi:hypothetical protein